MCLGTKRDAQLYDYFAKPITLNSRGQNLNQKKRRRTTYRKQGLSKNLNKTKETCHGVTDGDGELTQFVNSAGNGKANEELSGRGRDDESE